MTLNTKDYKQVRLLFETNPRTEILRSTTREELRQMYQTVAFRYAPHRWNKTQIAYGIACILGTLHW